MNNNIIASSPNIAGNIGSCEIKSDTYNISSFYCRTMAVNSCTGEVVSDTTFFQWGYIYLPFIIFLGITLVGILLNLEVKICQI